jgi:hypothetical protein
MRFGFSPAASDLDERAWIIPKRFGFFPAASDLYERAGIIPKRLGFFPAASDLDERAGTIPKRLGFVRASWDSYERAGTPTSELGFVRAGWDYSEALRSFPSGFRFGRAGWDYSERLRSFPSGFGAFRAASRSYELVPRVPRRVAAVRTASLYREGAAATTGEFLPGGGPRAASARAHSDPWRRSPVRAASHVRDGARGVLEALSAERAGRGDGGRARAAPCGDAVRRRRGKALTLDPMQKLHDAVMALPRARLHVAATQLAPQSRVIALNIGSTS